MDARTHETGHHFRAGGESRDEVVQALVSGRRQDTRWDDLHNLKASYFGGSEVVRTAYEAFHLYMGDNLIYGTTLYPSLPRIEAEVVAMGGEMLHAPPGFGGSVTTGGTESIICAMKAARDRAREKHPSNTALEVVLPRSAHVAFDKAAALLGVRSVRMQDSPGFRADVAGMRAAVNERTIMIVASAPPYPFGVMDPVEAVAAIAAEHDLWMHVDACVGGFVLPFMEDLGERIPPFDFRVHAVTSMSTDLHKYGYACRGSSLLLLRDRQLLEHQRFSSSAWNAGTYTTSGIAGSRPGGPLASAWAVMRHLGRDGYRERAAGILAARNRFVAGIAAIAGLEVWGTPEGGHFTFGSPHGDDGAALDMGALADAMQTCGWRLGRMRDPASILVLLNYQHGRIVDDFLADLSACAAKVGSTEMAAPSDEAVYVG